MSEALLSVDIDSALQKLSVGRLKNQDHVPLAVVRSFARLNPSGIRLKVTRKGFTIEHTGKSHSAVVFHLITSVLDTSRSEALRQKALDLLESLGQLDLLVAFCSGAQKTTWYCPSQNKTLVFEKCQIKIFQGKRSGNEFIEYLLPTKRHKQQVQELEKHLRFAPYEVVINGKVMMSGQRLSDSFFQMRFAHGQVFGTMAIPRVGLASCTYMIVNGVLEREIWESPGNGAVWEAVVYFEQGQSAQALSIVHDQLKHLYDSVKKSYPSFPKKASLRIREILFRMADHSHDLSPLSGIGIFRTHSGHSLTIEEVIDLGNKNRGLLQAIPHEVSSGNFIIDEDVLVLDETEGEFLKKHLRLTLEEPQRHPSRHLSIRHLTKPFSMAWSVGKRIFSKWSSTSILNTSLLDEQERLFVRKLQKIMNEDRLCKNQRYRVALCRGGLQAWRWDHGQNGEKMLLLKRRHPKVRKMIEALSATPKAIVPIAMLIGCDTDSYNLFPLAQTIVSKR